MQCCSTDSAKISLKFTDTSRFLEHLSVKPGLKRLNFYGQAAIFDHFVRNRHFSNRSFTYIASIFIDVSVNGSDFSNTALIQSARQAISQNYRYVLLRVISIMEGDCHAYEKTGLFLGIVFFSIFTYTNFTPSHLFCKITLLF